MKYFLKLNIPFHIQVILLVVLMSACLPTPKNSRTARSTLLDSQVQPIPSVAAGNKVYFQSGSVQYNSVFSVPSDFEDSFFLRGESIHGYINGSSGVNRSTPQCMILPYNLSAREALSDTVLVIAALPRFFSNFSTNTREYYYYLNAGEQSINSAQCQSAGLLNYLSTNYPGHTVTFKLSDICSTCSFEHTSQTTKLLTSSGGVISNIDLTSLRLKISSSANTPVTGSSCTSTPQCLSLGYDCCANGQCVKEGNVKSGVDTTSTEYLQALEDIIQNPENFTNYPEYFYVCSSYVPATPTPSPFPDANATAAARLENLGELKDCINPTDNEMSICTESIPNASTPIASGITFSTRTDDLNFSTIYTGTAGLLTHSIYEISYQGYTLYQDGTTYYADFIIGTGNDTLTDATSVTISMTPVPTAANDIVKIKYKLDGSCKKLSAAIARCKKYYVQGQNSSKVDDHFPASNEFKLPLYADISKNIVVTVDTVKKFENADWTFSTSGGTNTILFNGGLNLAVNDNQKVEIEFFVNLGIYPVMDLKQEAQEAVNNICDCGANDCNLQEVYKTNSTTEIVDYACIYPTPLAPEPPLQQEVQVSAKTAPVRFFDITGTEQTSINTTSAAQEGNAFEYTDGNKLKPNNVSSYVGFNEIYGSITTSVGNAKIPTQVNVKFAKSYDIFVDNAYFRPCIGCGNDYYDLLAKIFPENFNFRGGGYSPDPVRTEVRTSNNSGAGDYRRDDLLFGRACHVPATMIPWTHKSESDKGVQRQNRMKAQHFLFANGYGRDWYGFDYGALIGSFDGVRWFAIGNQRRIRADSTKLFLAINAPFSDLNQENNFRVTISQVSNDIFSGSDVTSDFESDGAECQKYHVCSTDQDCVSQLGWEYACVNIASIKTNWPVFDSAANELANNEQTKRLSELFNTTGNTNRCVYRGRGAPCHEIYTVSDSTNVYTLTEAAGFNMCNPNYYCQVFTDNGADQAKFNTKIARYGRSPSSQNNSSDVSVSLQEDIVGFAARIIGRPFYYEGADAIDSIVKTSLTYNNVDSLCLPGRNPDSASSSSILNQHSQTPSADYKGDKINGIGMSRASLATSYTEYLNSCAVFNEDGNFYYRDNFTDAIDNLTLASYAGTQAISTNSLTIFEATGEDITTDFEANVVEERLFEENRCLRAPGSTCFSDLDCAPNWLAKRFTQDLSELDFTPFIVNIFEFKFWQEELICHQKEDKTSPLYDLKKNVCCRDLGKTLTIATDTYPHATPAVGTPRAYTDAQVPGIDYSLSTYMRNSRMAPVYYDMLANPATFPKLSASNSTPDTASYTANDHPSSQWKTFDAIASRTCCSKNWIRNFHENNGGGHAFGPAKTQRIEKTVFECQNWVPGSGANYSCDLDINDPTTCFQRQITTTESNRVFDWVTRFELLGIPQILIPENNVDMAVTSPMECNIEIDSGNTNATDDYMPNFIDASATPEYTGNQYEGGSSNYFVGNDATNFDSSLDLIFSEDEVTCCKPAGELIDSSVTDNMCCTGKKVQNRCCLPDYANVTLYLNRFVSSEANELADSLFDQDTGYPISAAVVAQIAASKNICCSGEAPVPGIAVSDLKYRGAGFRDETIRRFVSSNQSEDNPNGQADLYDAGQRWNTHLYCIPAQDGN